MKLDTTSENHQLRQTQSAAIVPAPARRRKRELSVDVLRGLAVMLMIATHAVAFFHIGDDQVVNIIGTFGGTVSFVLFLFISGVAAYLSYVRYADTEQIKLAHRRSSIIYRSITLLAGYYFLAIVASIPSYSFPPNLGWVENLTRTALFTNIPAFTEFIIPFVLLGLLLIPLRKFYRFILQYPPLAFAIGGLFFALGQVLSSIKIDGELVYLKSILVGEGDWHRFPIFQYLLVYLLGMAWGKFLEHYNDETYRNKIALLSVLASGALLAVGVVSSSYLQMSWLEPLFRWPPSITFLLIGVVTYYVMFLIVNLTGYLRILGPGQVFIHYMGVKAFDFFIAHTLILFVYKYLTNDQHHESAILLLLLYIGLLILSVILISLKDWLVDILRDDTEETEGFGWLFSERVAVTFVWVVLILLAGMGAIQGNAVQASSTGEDVSFKKKLIREEDWPYWWDHNYNYYQQIIVSNPENSLPVYRNSWQSIKFDHAGAISAGRAMASGADLRIVFYSDENGFIELPFVLEGIGGTATIKFKLQDEVFAGQTDDRYFLYYGNPGNSGYPASQENPATTRTEGLTLADMTAHKVTGSTNRKWLLKQGDRVLEYSTLLYTVQLDSNVSPDSIVSYSIEGTSLRGMMDDLGGGKFQAAINIKQLDIGTHKIQAVAREKENKLKVIESGYTQFYVSYPLYVVWSQDWEGWDVPDQWLRELDAMAVKYGIRMTHFFNPYIYVNASISRQRADQLTLWVQNRSKNYSDEISLHLHMWYAMVRSAGVNPKSTDYAPWLYGDGGGVAAYTYTVEEMKTILNWSKTMFQDNGLPPSPTSFRAGGWLLKTNTLQSLQETGFLLDSSGRTRGGTDTETRKMASLPPPWDLSPTQRPYKPSLNDQNSSAEPTFNIWEFPNNGADSIWYTETEMIRRFDLNYPNKGQVMTEPQVLTYLSHPQFWNIDKARVDKLFSYIGNYLYRDDRGPVIYTTLESAYTSWDKE